MIDLPTDLQDTIRLLYATSMNDLVRWPSIDEDQIGVHARSWFDAASTLTATVNDPMAVSGTIWNPRISWEAGDDKPLDAFVNFWTKYPHAHYNLAASQATAVSGALNNAAQIVKSYKMNYLTIVRAAKDVLTQDYHALGASTEVLWLFPAGSETSVSSSEDWQLARGETLQKIAPSESADRLKNDQDAINTCVSGLVSLGNKTHSDLALQQTITDQATKVMNNIRQNASQAAGKLPDQSFTAAKDPYGLDSGDEWGYLYDPGDDLPPNPNPDGH
jgi:hypothetical protein